MTSAVTKFDHAADLIRRSMGIDPANEQAMVGIRRGLGEAMRADLLRVPGEAPSGPQDASERTHRGDWHP